MKKYYAVKALNFTNIYETWDEAKAIIPTLTKPQYKAFTSLEDAEAFLSGTVLKPVYTSPTAYIDGSYDDSTLSYSFGGVLFYNNNEFTFKKKYENDQYAGVRNVAGEIKGAAYIINYCIKNNIPKLDIYYDFIGIENWYTKKWKASTPIAIEYVRFADSVRDKIEIVFHKVKSHTNNYYNDLADKLAKEALGI